MADPQLENGHTKIANEIIEALSRINLSPYESRVLWALIRKTYGWNKKMDKVSQSQISEMTGMYKQHVSRAFISLKARSIVTSTGDKRVGINKDYDQWSPAEVTKKTPIKVTSTGEKVTSTGVKKSPVQAPQKTKDIIQKKISIDYPEWLDMEQWKSFLEMRKMMKKPMTDRGQELAIKKLSDMKASGQSVDRIIDRSIMHNWMGLFPLKDDEVSRTSHQSLGERPQGECEV